MLGNKTLFVPGFDHAGISTQSVVEKRLFKSEGKTRHDLGREKFLETVMDWKNEYVLPLHPLRVLTSLQLPRTYHEPAPSFGRQLRLGSRRIHHGRGSLSLSLISNDSFIVTETQQSRHRDLLQTPRRRHPLPRQPPRQLVCQAQHHPLQPRSRAKRT
jgi:hypothetical protein